MANKFLNVLGLMSGTSMDGIDMSIITTNGKEIINNGKNFYYKFPKIFRLKLNKFVNTFEKDFEGSKYFISLSNSFTNFNIEAIKKIKSEIKIDLIGFHGQTIYHNPKIRKSIQIGSPNLIFQKLKIPIIYNFRENDIANDGQGAPLAPIYHKLLIMKNKFELPCIFINIGGISNLTYWDGKVLLGFDIGPGNCLLDDFVQNRTHNLYDKNGVISSRGSANTNLIKIFFQDPYFKLPPPKSLDRNYFHKFQKKIMNSELSIEDSLNTLVEITVLSILKSLKFVPKPIKGMFISGGGVHNKYLYSRLKEIFKTKIIYNDFSNLNVNFIESELVAYIAARSFYKLPITFPLTTGVRKPLSGGKIII